MPKPKNDHTLVVDHLINNIISDRAIISDYIGKHELWEKLTKQEQKFLESVSVACQELADTNVIRGEL